MEQNYVIVTDSSCDLPAELAQELELAVLPLTLTLGGQEYANYLDGREIGFSEFYGRIRQGEVAVTAAANVESYLSLAEPILREGKDLLILAFSFFPEREPYESMLGAAFLAIVAAAVYFLVYGGAMEDKYDIAKYNRRNNPTDEDRARRSRANTACAVIMLLATALFLFVGMSFENWKMAAVIYPVAGILCGAAWMLLGPKTAE